MSARSRTIEVDNDTADLIERRASECGLSVSQLLADLLLLVEGSHTIDEHEGAAELERRWASVAGGAKTTSHADVVRWLQTWGTPAFAPWQRG